MPIAFFVEDLECRVKTYQVLQVAVGCVERCYIHFFDALYLNLFPHNFTVCNKFWLF